MHSYLWQQIYIVTGHMLRLLTPYHVNGIWLRSESLQDENHHIDYKSEVSFLFASHANSLVHCSHFYSEARQTSLCLHQYFSTFMHFSQDDFITYVFSLMSTFSVMNINKISRPAPLAGTPLLVWL